MAKATVIGLALLLFVGLLVRLPHLGDPPLGFRPVRQYRSAILARGYYFYFDSPSVVRGSLIQAAEHRFIAGLAARLPMRVRAPLLKLAERYPDADPQSAFTAYVSLPLVRPDFLPSNYGSYLRYLVGRRPTDSILVVVSSDGAYPELTRGFVSSQLLALGYVPAPDRNGRRFESLKTEVVAFRHRNAGAFR